MKGFCLVDEKSGYLYNMRLEAGGWRLEAVSQTLSKA
jgi:hypothetical protein